MKDLDFRWDITSEEVYAPDIDETDEERRERMLNEDPYLGVYGYTEDDIPDYDDDEDGR
jgi:hypothetical protein